ncbi:tripartite tricarboxylate transporter TctB family protein [Acidaminococcus sp. LBK-2]|uniref:tripartite tricarboxylate transporter TctB family protein n=1 Tax=Acidaminococcus sp. LBK-2 TaxID=3456956 RepID=UPI003FA41E26
MQQITSSIIFLIISGIVFFSCYLQLGKTNLTLHPYMMPTILSGLMVCLCILRLIVGLRMPADTEKRKHGIFVEVSRKNLVTMGLIAVYAGCMKSIGFIISTFVYMMIQMFILKEGKKNWGLMIGVSLIMSIGIYFIFVNLFDILLPAGVLDFI